MPSSRTPLHGQAAASAGLAGAIAMAIVQVIGMFISNSVAATLLYGLSLAFIAFGGTYAGVFFASLAASRRHGHEGAQPQGTAG